MYYLAPSILSADFAQLGKDIQTADAAGADMFHIDVMDGTFVPNLSIGFPVISAIRPYTKKPFDVHLMVDDPGRYIGFTADSGADSITVHEEACPHLHRTLKDIQAHGCKTGVALNPQTSPERLRYMLKNIDMILIMTVDPGFPGKGYIREMLEKIRDTRKMIDASPYKNISIEVDGGVKPDNLHEFLEAGANIFVAGSAVYNGGDIAQNIRTLKDKIQECRDTPAWRE